MRAIAIRLVWCQGGNAQSARLAVGAGWWYGFRSDDNNYAAELGPVAMLDCHWENPDWQRHLALAARHRPWLATVPDTMTEADTDRTVRQAEEIAPFCDHPLVVPKAPGVIRRLPRKVGGKTLVLGYSVPTAYGGTELGVWDFAGWPVHLLGGNPRRQLDLARYMDTVSVDGNLAWRLARRGIVMKENGAAGRSIREYDGGRWHGEGAHLEALRRSLASLKTFWGRHTRVEWRPAA